MGRFSRRKNAAESGNALLYVFIATGILLSREGAPAVHRLVGFMMETDADPVSTARYFGDTPMTRLLVQLYVPFVVSGPMFVLPCSSHPWLRMLPTFRFWLCRLYP